MQEHCSNNERFAGRVAGLAKGDGMFQKSITEFGLFAPEFGPAEYDVVKPGNIVSAMFPFGPEPVRYGLG